MARQGVEVRHGQAFGLVEGDVGQETEALEGGSEEHEGGEGGGERATLVSGQPGVKEIALRRQRAVGVGHGFGGSGGTRGVDNGGQLILGECHELIASEGRPAGNRVTARYAEACRSGREATQAIDEQRARCSDHRHRSRGAQEVTKLANASGIVRHHRHRAHRPQCRHGDQQASTGRHQDRDSVARTNSAGPQGSRGDCPTRRELLPGQCAMRVDENGGGVIDVIIDDRIDGVGQRGVRNRESRGDVGVEPTLHDIAEALIERGEVGTVGEPLDVHVRQS